MKKFGRFLFGSAALAAAGAGAYLLYKNLIEKPKDEDDDEFMDDLDDYDLEEDGETPKAPEYVSINPEAAKDAVEEVAEKTKDAIDGISKAVSDITG